MAESVLPFEGSAVGFLVSWDAAGSDGVVLM
jgi:hypothetical protein